MSMIYCLVCDQHIDTDYDVEHLDGCTIYPEEETEHGTEA